MNADKTNAERSPLDSESRALTPSRAAPLPKKKNGAPHGNKNASRLNPKVKAVVALLLTDPKITVEAACEQAQCARRTFYKAERSEAYAAHIASLGRTRLRTRILAKAMHRYEALIDGESEYVAADISKDALAQAGVRDKLDGAQRQQSSASISIVINAPQRSIGAASVQIVEHEAKPDDTSEG